MSRGRGLIIATVVLPVLIGAFCLVCWIGNLVKLSQCDWDKKGSWKGEVLHLVGVIPGVSTVTFWFNDK